MTFGLDELDDDKAIVAAMELLEELAAARAAVDRYERRAVGIRKMLDGLVELFPVVEDVLPEDLDEDEAPRPRGAEAARLVLAELSGQWMTVPTIVELLERRDWLPNSSNPPNAVRTALQRLVDDKTIEKSRSTEGAVIYRVPPRPEPNPPPQKSSYDEEPF